MVESIILGAFGDKIFAGVITGVLAPFGVSDVYDCIQRDADLEIPTPDLPGYRALAEKMGVTVDTQMVMSAMAKCRPDIASLILNHPNGLKWLDRQVALLKGKLA